MDSSQEEQPTSGWTAPENRDPTPPATDRQRIPPPEPITCPPSYQELTVPAFIPTLQQTQPKTEDAWRLSFKRSALVQGVCGFLCIALGFISVGMDCVYGDTGIAIWSGVWIVFSAFLGVSSIRHPGNTCVATTYMIFSSFSIACAILILSVYCAAAIAEDPQHPSTPYAARVAVDAMLALVGFIELIAAVFGCIAAGKRLCRNDADDVMIQRHNYYVSHLRSQDVYLHTGESGPPQYQQDFHPLQVPTLPQYGTIESPPPYEVPSSQSRIQGYKNSEQSRSHVHNNNEQ